MRMYKKVGTDPALIDRYRRYQQFCSCLKLDLLFQLSLVTVCVLGFDTFSWQWWLTSLLHAPIALAWLPLGLGGGNLRRTHALGSLDWASLDCRTDQPVCRALPRAPLCHAHACVCAPTPPPGAVRRESAAAVNLLLLVGTLQPLLLTVELLGRERHPQHGQRGRLVGATAGHHGLPRLRLEAWSCPRHSGGEV